MTDTSHYLSGEDYTRDANGVALPPDVVAWPVGLLPAGVHPGDASTAQEAVPGVPLDHEKGQQWRPGREPWGVDNEEALPVYNRAAHDWSPGQVWCNSTVNSGVQVVNGRQAGRASVTVWVPLLDPNGNAPLGVMIGPTTESVIQGGIGCVVLNIGDSITIPSEGPVYAGCISGNSTGFCQYMSLTNPLGRGRDLGF